MRISYDKFYYNVESRDAILLEVHSIPKSKFYFMKVTNS